MTTELLEFLNSNTHRNYPLSENVTGASTTGGVYLPQSFLVSLDIVCPTFMDGSATEDEIRSRFSVASVNWALDKLIVEVAYTPIGTNDAIIFGRSETIPTKASADGVYPKYDIFPILTNPTTALQRALSRATGTLYVCTTSDLVVTGSYTFNVSTARLQPTCVHLYGTLTQQPEEDTGLSTVIVRTPTGDVEISKNFVIRANTGVSLEVTQEGSEEEGYTPVLTISPTDSIEDLTEAILAALGNPITSISGSGPAPDGNVTINGNDCVSVTPISHGVSISNPCSKPCCDDTDTQSVTNALNALDEAKTRLETYYQALATNINTMQARLSSLIAARNGNA